MIPELMFYKFELSHNTTETMKNICWVKGEGAVDYSIVNRGGGPHGVMVKVLDYWMRVSGFEL